MSRIKGVENVMIRPSMINKQDGKVLVRLTTGKVVKRWPVDAKEIVAMKFGELVDKPTAEEAVTNQNTDEEEEVQAATPAPAPETSEEESKPEPEAEFDYDVPASAPKQR